MITVHVTLVGPVVRVFVRGANGVIEYFHSALGNWWSVHVRRVVLV